MEVTIKAGDSEVTIKRESEEEPTWADLFDIFVKELHSLGYYPETLDAVNEVLNRTDDYKQREAVKNAIVNATKDL